MSAHRDRLPAATPRSRSRPAQRLGDHTVLDGIDLSVPRGTVLALLGPNGAGKTTTVNILSTLLAPDGGTVRVSGHDIRPPGRVRSASESPASSPRSTTCSPPRRTCSSWPIYSASARSRSAPVRGGAGAVRDLGRRATTGPDLLRWVAAPARPRDGPGRRPAVIFLDEPTTGLDPRAGGTCGTWSLAGRGRHHDFLTTQYLEEADQLADRIAVLDGGRIVAEGSADELKAPDPRQSRTLRFADPAEYERASARPPWRHPRRGGPRPARGGRRRARRAARPARPARRRRIAADSPYTPPTWTTCSSP